MQSMTIQQYILIKYMVENDEISIEDAQNSITDNMINDVNTCIQKVNHMATSNPTNDNYYECFCCFMAGIDYIFEDART